MLFTIRLRDYTTTIDIPKDIFMRFHDLGEIAEYICNQLAEKYALSMIRKRKPLRERGGKTKAKGKSELAQAWYSSHYFQILEILKRDLGEKLGR
jgi:hypothetical protein